MFKKLREKMHTFFSQFKINSIRQRWLINNILTVVTVVIIAICVYSISVARYYYSSVQSALEAKAKTASSFFENYVANTYAEYYDSAYKFIETFEDADKIELQFINSSGIMIVSSNSLTGGFETNEDDIKIALSTGLMTTRKIKSEMTGESIIAVSAPMVDQNGTVIGVMRYLTGLRLVNREITVNVVMAICVGLFIIMLIVITNSAFIKSVVDPIQDITAMAKRISDGSYGIRIGKKYKDEIGEMVDAINEMSVKIAQSEKAQTEFISSVSHELRTPLTAITGWSETMLYDDTLNEDAKKGISIIFAEAKRLTNMVEELLEFTRIQDGRFTLNIQKIDISAELEESIITYRELLKRENIELEFVPYEGELPIINGDPERLKQVFLNILDNAAKYGGEGGKIVVSMTLKGDYINISIRDFGPGIPEDELQYVKMKFYKGSSTKRGSGIGLAVCEEIIGYHNGILELKNAEGGGLMVTIKLPVYD